MSRFLNFLTGKSEKCKFCFASITKNTVAKQEGRCDKCYPGFVEINEKNARYEHALESGDVFLLSDHDLATAIKFDEFPTPHSWRLQDEYYENSPISSIQDVLNEARLNDEGEIYLWEGEGVYLSLVFNTTYGVCEYQHFNNEIYVYAHSDDNMNSQVLSAQHLEQGCPCCGVGINFYPSRFHMPREQAFSIFEATIAQNHSQKVLWVGMEDLSYVVKGKG